MAKEKEMSQLSKLGVDPFSAPIPGGSLTQPKGGAPYETPAQFSTPEAASEYIFDQMVLVRNSARIIVLLKAGMSCEFLAKTLVFTGFQKGKWTVDTALLIARVVLYMVVSVAHRAKANGLLKDFKLMDPDKEQNDFMGQFMGFDKTPKVDPKDTAKVEQQITKDPLELEMPKGPMSMGA